MLLMSDQRSPRLTSLRFENVDLTEGAEISGMNTSSSLQLVLYVNSHGLPLF